MSLPLGEVTIGHVLDVLARWPAASVHCVVTSPPYWALRKYAGEQEVMWPGGARSAYGIEPLHDCGRLKGDLCSVCYVCHTLTILRAIRRVLRPDGVVWWNLGDSYAGSGGAHENDVSPGISQSCRRFGGAGDTIGSDGYERRNRNERGRVGPSPGLKPGDLCMIPQRVALAAQADGWYVRSEVIYAKQNPMPESVSGWRWHRHRVKVTSGRYDSDEKQAITRTGAGFNQRWEGEEGWSAQWQDCPGCGKCADNDGLVLRRGSWRPTTAHEKVLLLAASENYWADGEDVREKASLDSHGGGNGDQRQAYLAQCGRSDTGEGLAQPGGVAGRNLRTVWTLPTVGYPGAHFATFPPALPMHCILAGCPPRVCAKCGTAWARVLERTGGTVGHSWTDHKADMTQGMRQVHHSVGAALDRDGKAYSSRTLGWRPTCSCGVTDWLPGIVLDPFMGSGTTAWVAERLGRRWVGIDISEAYDELARARLGRLEIAESEGEAMVLPFGDEMLVVMPRRGGGVTLEELE